MMFLGRTLARCILDRWVPEGVVRLAGDDTVDEHRGKKVYGKGCHRDAVRSTHTYTAYRWGHKWVVLAILVRFPWAKRPWALPVLVALYRSKKWNKQHGRRHKTPVMLMRQLVLVMMRWFPKRQFVFAGDGGYATHDMARMAPQSSNRLAVVSRFYPDANLYEPATRKGHSLRGKRGRPRVKGKKLPSPQEVVARAKRQKLTVSWYGGGERRVEVVTGVGGWYKGGEGLVQIRWVFVHDLTGTHRDEYFFTTDVNLTPARVIEEFTGRWSIETTFQEMRAHLGLETTCGWCEKTILRAAPSLFGLYSVVVLLYAMVPCSIAARSRVRWVNKDTITFSDAIAAVRRWIWVDWIFETTGHKATFTKLSTGLRETLLRALAAAA